MNRPGTRRGSRRGGLALWPRGLSHDQRLLVASVIAGILGAGALAMVALFGVAPPPSGPRIEAVASGPASPPARAVAAEVAPADTRRPEARARIDPEWVDRVSKRTAIPAHVLEVYAATAARTSAEQPGCGLGWNTLAGIGMVESEHGTIDGRIIAPNGRITPPLVGIPLDGISTRAIPDTDDGALDHDSVWDRAVGPMQFIPSTWDEWGSDGDRDGITDPQDLDDAVYSAARYLCASGVDLTDAAGWIAAVAAYNDAVDYNHRVADAAEHYAALAE